MPSIGIGMGSKVEFCMFCVGLRSIKRSVSLMNALSICVTGIFALGENILHCWALAAYTSIMLSVSITHLGHASLAPCPILCHGVSGK